MGQSKKKKNETPKIVENKRGFYIGNLSSESDFKAILGALETRDGKDIISATIKAQDDSEIARIESENAHYPLYFLKEVDALCKDKDCRAYVSNDKINLSIGAWYHYKENDVDVSECEEYPEFLQKVWGDWILNN